MRPISSWKGELESYRTSGGLGTAAETHTVSVKADTSYARDGNTRLTSLKYSGVGYESFMGIGRQSAPCPRALLNFFVNSFQKIYHALIAEFLSKMHAFDILSFNFSDCTWGRSEVLEPPPITQTLASIRLPKWKKRLLSSSFHFANDISSRISAIP